MRSLILSAAAEPLISCEVEVVFHIQQHLSDETQPLLLKLLALVEHLLHALYVGLSATVQLVQNLLVLFFSLGWNVTFYLNVTFHSDFSVVIQKEQPYGQLFACASHRLLWGLLSTRQLIALTFSLSCLHLSNLSWSFFCWSALVEVSPLLLASLMEASFSSLQAMW